MATVRFTHSCGHDGRIDGRNRADADRKAKYFASDPCWECRKAAENEAARLAAEAAGLPALTGTEKQIPYGTAMRHAKLPQFEAAVRLFRARMEKMAALDANKASEVSDAVALLESEVHGQTEARFWIEAEGTDAAWLDWMRKQIHSRSLAPTAMPPAQG